MTLLTLARGRPTGANTLVHGFLDKSAALARLAETRHTQGGMA